MAPLPPRELLAQMLGDHGMSQAEPARTTGLTSTTVSDLVTGKRAFTVKQVHAVGSILAVTWIVRGFSSKGPRAELFFLLFNPALDAGAGWHANEHCRHQDEHHAERDGVLLDQVSNSRQERRGFVDRPTNDGACLERDGRGDGLAWQRGWILGWARAAVRRARGCRSKSLGGNKTGHDERERQ